MMAIFEGIFFGMVDSLKGVKVIYDLHRQEQKSNKERHDNRVVASTSQKSSEPEGKNVVKKVFQCCAYNGGIFFMSLASFDYLLLPYLQRMTLYIHGTEMGADMWLWINRLLVLTIIFLWVLPLFIIGRIVNTLWFMEIANSVFRARNGRPKSMGTVAFASDLMMSILVQFLFLAQNWVLGFTPWPYLNMISNIVHMSLLYSLYAFEYKWFNLGWGLNVRLDYIENNWPYFFGFGLPLAIITELPRSFFLSGCIFATLFPLIILSSNEVVPRKQTCLCISLTNLFLSTSYQKKRPAARTRRESSVQPSPQSSRNVTPQPSTPSMTAVPLSRTQRHLHHQHQHSRNPNISMDDQSQRRLRRSQME